MPIDIKLKAELEEMDRTYGGENLYKMFGPTLLTYPTATDSSRLYMFTSHEKQVLCLLNPDVPRLQTGFENTIGEYNKAFRRMEGTWEVMDIIEKYPGYNGVYAMVLHNRKKDTYDIIEKPIAESLTEKFGYLYQTAVMDGLKVGDKITDKVIYKSTSYDDHDPMNYRYGKNARVMFSTSTDTLEDAIRVRRSWAEQVKTVEVDNSHVSINTNDVLLNLYGDDDNYKAFPDIGEHAKNSVLCATRRINQKHVLYDFQSRNMHTIYNTDTDYYVTKDSVVYDIDVYYNGDEPFPTNVFHSQLRKYYEMGQVYADKIYAWATKIKKSGSKYTQNVTYLRSRYMNYTDPEYKWKDKDRAFANIVVDFKVHAVVSLDPGSKLTGRYGDKGVIGDFAEDLPTQVTESILDMVCEPGDPQRAKYAQSIEIVDDERMPYTDRGPIDILLNMSGCVRRLTPGQVGEVEVNFQAENVQYYIRENCNTMEEKLEVALQFLELVNPDQKTFFMNLFSHEFDKVFDLAEIKVRLHAPDAQRDFIRNIEEKGFYLRRPPHTPLLYHDIKKIYDAFPWIKPYPVYIDLFGVKRRRVMKDAVVGWKYMIVLKQNSNKNFSARSTFRINRSNLPTKDAGKKTNRTSYAKTPVRLSEIYNLLASISGRDLAEFNIFSRSSALGRKSLQRILEASGNPLEIKRLKIHDNYINTNADILNARFKGVGIGLRFRNSSQSGVGDVYLDAATELKIGPYTVMASPVEYAKYKDIFDHFDAEMRKSRVVESEPGEKQKLCWNAVFADPEIRKYNISDSDKEILMAATASLINILERVKTKAKLKDADLEQADPFNPDGTPVRRRRGRRSKAEKEE